MGDGWPEPRPACNRARRYRRAHGDAADRGGDRGPAAPARGRAGPRRGTDYLDLCGEPLWMRQMIDAHEATAKSSGARIVFSCGFDSLPFELGVYFVQETAKKVF